MNRPCEICRNTATTVIWSKPNFELYQFPFATEQDINTYRMDQTIHFCGRCHHAFLWPTPDDQTLNAYYESGWTGYTSTLETDGLESSVKDPACEYIAEEIDRRFERPVRIAEIGGHDGYVLSQLAHLAEERLLIEPSQHGATIARQHGISVLEAFFDEAVAQRLAGQFDVVISRHVVEHVRDPSTFIGQLTTLLGPNGILVLEQPDLPRILDSLLVRVLILIHLRHFSPRSLNWLVTKSLRLVMDRVAFMPSGFIVTVTKQVDPLKTTRDEGLRDIDSEPVILANAEAFSKRLGGRNSKLTKLISEWRRQDKKIWVWGAGTAASELFNVYGQQKEHFRGYIDSDERKVGMRFASAPELPIYTPATAYEHGIDAVLIATFSVDEVLSTIGDLGWEIDVAALHTGDTYPVGR